MNEATVIGLADRSLWVALQVGGPILGISLVDSVSTGFLRLEKPAYAEKRTVELFSLPRLVVMSTTPLAARAP